MAALTGRRVAVLGDGIVGLATAAEAIHHGAQATVYSDTTAIGMASHAASDKACALWFPALLDQADQDQLDRWCSDSYTLYSRLHAAGCPGINRIINIEIIDAEHDFSAPPRAISSLPEFQAFRTGLSALRGGPAGAWRFTSFVISMPVFLPELRRRLKASGVEIVHAHFRSLSDLLGKVKEKIIFDCLGAGASSIFHDTDIKLVKGHLLLFPPVDLHYSIGRYDMALIPREDALVCGSLFLDQFDTVSPVAADRERILAEVTSWVEADLMNVGLKSVRLASNRIVTELTGLRPCRRGGVRLDYEELDDRIVVHDYGHGGSGITIAPGCAREAVALAEMAALA